MKKPLLFTAAMLVLLIGLYSFISSPREVQTTFGKSFYDLSIKTLDGKSTIHFKDFKGKKVLCVNTASQCGFTHQYTGLERLSQKYKDRLVVIGFPCNQFGEQEPWEPDHIGEFCKARYGVTFPLTEKINVKGDSAHAVYKWLTKKDYNGVKDVNIRWNFGKFLIDEKGKFVEYFPSKVAPEDAELIAAIEK